MKTQKHSSRKTSMIELFPHVLFDKYKTSSPLVIDRNERFLNSKLNNK